jgi:predicted RNase H-like HicB family nuclease
VKYTLVCWKDEGWYVGRLEELPGVFSQGKTLDELMANIGDACRLLLEDDEEPPLDGRGVPARPSQPPALRVQLMARSPDDLPPA